MRILLREYVSMLKEEGELDNLVSDLLLSMGLHLLSRPQKGVRQYGVDIPAVGADPCDGDREKLTLLQLKTGDLNRSSWDDPQNGVRSSLNEIHDVYLKNHIQQAHVNLPIKIIVCCSGELRQEVEQNWAGYTKRNPDPERIEYALWDATRLALLIEQFLMNESLVPEIARKDLRKTVALVSDNDYDLAHFHSLFKVLLPRPDVSLSTRELKKRILTANLCLNLVYRWARDENNLRQAYNAAEYAMLSVWEWFRRADAFDKVETMSAYARVYETFREVGKAIFGRIQPHCHVRDALFGYGADRVEYPMRTFEAIGVISIIGLDQYQQFALPKEEVYAKNAEVISDSLAELLQNNPASMTPLFDEHGIDICLGLLLLTGTGRTQVARDWIEELVGHISLGIKCGEFYPISTNSYDDLLETVFETSLEKTKYFGASTLVPALAEWAALLRLEEAYSRIVSDSRSLYGDTVLQLWYPGEDTEEIMYRGFGGSESGDMEVPILLPDSMEDCLERMRKRQMEVTDSKSFSCLAGGVPILALIASRHYRTPVFPCFWQTMAGVPVGQEEVQPETT